MKNLDSGVSPIYFVVLDNHSSTGQRVNFVGGGSVDIEASPVRALTLTGLIELNGVHSRPFWSVGQCQRLLSSPRKMETTS